MAATKHSLADSEDRPSKKTKVDSEEKARLKAEKRERKEKRKEKKAQESEPSAENSDAERAAEKERKKAKKQKKLEKKQKQAEAETEASADVSEEPPKKKSKKEKTKTPTESSSDAEAPSSGSYTQTIALSNVPQSEIDEFLSKNEIYITDPKTETVTLRPVLEFHQLPATNLLEKKPSPFANYKAPTPIQSASWPFTLSGRDVIGVAETGSGKTMAFALPCVEAVSSIKHKHTKAVVVSPTRELAMQTYEQMASVAALNKLKCVCLYGGASKDDQRNLINRGADIIVATPGRLKDFMSDGTVDLSHAAFVVLDEADRMLDKGFEEDIKMILGACPPREQRQTLMFTATWPQSVQSLASTFMISPVKITIGSGGKETAGGAVELQANARISQRVEVLEPRGKEFRLLQILKEHQQGKQKNDRILVFCLYKKEATRIENFLSRKGIRVGGIHGDLRQEQRTKSLEAFKSGHTPVLVATDVAARGIHGDLRQEQRTKSLEAFKSGHTPVLVATDVAARGLDIPEVKLVINVTFPLTIEDYVHRIGRTGRAGKTGEAITFFTVEDKSHSGSLVNILRGANQPVPEDLLKFGTTVKKKAHDMYGAFFKDVDMNAKSTKITFD